MVLVGGGRWYFVGWWFWWVVGGVLGVTRWCFGGLCLGVSCFGGWYLVVLVGGRWCFGGFMVADGVLVSGVLGGG